LKSPSTNHGNTPLKFSLTLLVAILFIGIEEKSVQFPTLGYGKEIDLLIAGTSTPSNL
jgi:hypothetical protein